MHEVLKITGGNLGPMEAWLLLRGIKTMPLRMRQQCANALQVANGLALLPKIGQRDLSGPPHPPPAPDRHTDVWRAGLRRDGGL